MTARGVRNNNPGNLRHGPNWQGLSPTQPDSAFSTFVDMEHGIRALLKNLRTYVQTHNLQTVRQIISRWAPANENNTDAYVLAVAESLGVGPDQKIVGDFGQLLGIAKAIARHENGKDADLITKDQWNRGFELAFGEPEEIKVGAVLPIKPITEHQTMPIAPILAAVLPTFLEAAPKLIRIFGDGKQSDRNARAAQIVADIAKEATGATNEQAAAEVISRDPKAAEAFQTAVQERWFELTEVGGGIPEARKFMDKMTGEGPQWRQIGYSVMVAVLAFLIVGGGGYVLASIALDSGEDPQLRAGIVEYAKNIGLIVAGFVFGSSVTSRQKDQALLERR
jgi:hypothetical protein